MLIEKDLIHAKVQRHSLHNLLSDSSPTLVLLPKLEIIVNKEEPTLEDILMICSHDQELLDKLTRRSGFEGSSEDFAKDILFKKGLGFLKSLAIRTMNQEIFTLPLGLNGMSTGLIKRRTVILARFLKKFRADLIGNLTIYISLVYYITFIMLPMNCWCNLAKLKNRILKMSGRNASSYHVKPFRISALILTSLEF